jgi:hypothetical protein
MSETVYFTPFLEWVDVTDPASIPPDARKITASDLMRYEHFGVDAAAQINAQGRILDQITTPNGAFVLPKVPTTSTANRPAAATVGAGAHMFDITLNKPIWSTGTDWVDATGAIV